MPITATKAGRALNRRVEIHITSSSVSDSSKWSVVKEQSGEKRVETNAIRDVSPKNDSKAASDTSSKKPPVDSASDISEQTIVEPEGILSPADKDILVNRIKASVSVLIPN